MLGVFPSVRFSLLTVQEPYYAYGVDTKLSQNQKTYNPRVAASRNTSSGTAGNSPSKIPRSAPRRDAAAYQARYFAFDGVKGRQGFRDPVKWW